MLARSNRTFICSVVFLDIVEYSKKPVAEQIRLKERLNALLAETLKDVAANDRIILDTGDGVAVSFIGDPEDALFTCLTLRDAVTHSQPAEDVPLNLRTGINLGPVRLIKDLNGQPNLIGDGINVAQRVMSFATPNEILVSRSYYEVVSCLSDVYARLFEYQGSRTDKHVREHEVYAVGEGSQELRNVLDPAHGAGRGPRGFADTGSVMGRLTHSVSVVNENLRRRPRLGTAAAVAAILVTAIVLRGLREQPATRAEKPTAMATAPVAPAPAGDQANAAPASNAPLKKKSLPPAADGKWGVDGPKRAPASGTGIVALTITPWGEIHVDGKRLGDVPPMHELRLSAGRHRIEIRHPDYPPYVQTVEVRPGDRIAIRHWFQKEKVPLPWK